MLGARNSSQIDKFYTRGKSKEIDVCYFSQSYFGLPIQSVRKNSDIIKLFKQILRDVESMYEDFGGYDMKYDNFKVICRKAWSEKFNYLCFDMTKSKLKKRK